MSLDTSNLSAELQERLSDEEAIFEKYFNPMDGVLDAVAVFDDVVDKLPLYNLDVADPNQPGKSTFTPKSGVLDWKNRTLEVKEGEVTLEITRDQIEAMHRTHLAKIRNEARRGSVYDLPFEDYMLERVIMKSAQNLRNLALFKGVLNAAGTTSADILDGWLTLIAADIIATNIPAANVFTGGAITSANAEAQFNGVRDIVIAQNPEYIDQPLVCLAAPENVQNYWTNYQANHGALPYNTSFERRNLEGLSNCPIIPEIGMTGSDRIVITPAFNMAFGSDAAERMSNIEIERHKRNLLFMIDFKIGVNYGIAELIWTNDQA